MIETIKKYSLKYGNILCMLLIPPCLYLGNIIISDSYVYELLLICIWLGYIGCVWSLAKFIHFRSHSKRYEKIVKIIPQHIRTWYPLYLFFFYPLSKMILALFNLNWRTNIDFAIFMACIIGIVMYFLFRIFKDMPILVSTVILFKAIPYILGVFCLFYLSAATLDGEEIVENGQRYVISLHSDLTDEQSKKYKVVDPCFRSLFSIEYDIDHIDGN